MLERLFFCSVCFRQACVTSSVLFWIGTSKESLKRSAKSCNSPIWRPSSREASTKERLSGPELQTFFFTRLGGYRASGIPTGISSTPKQTSFPLGHLIGVGIAIARDPSPDPNGRGGGQR